MLTAKVVKVLLQYLYTGRCLFPRDDLNLGIELMAAADQFLLDPMKAQCEQILSQKIDEEVCILLANFDEVFRFVLAINLFCNKDSIINLTIICIFIALLHFV